MLNSLLVPTVIVMFNSNRVHACSNLGPCEWPLTTASWVFQLPALQPILPCLRKFGEAPEGFALSPSQLYSAPGSQPTHPTPFLAPTAQANKGSHTLKRDQKGRETTEQKGSRNYLYCQLGDHKRRTLKVEVLSGRRASCPTYNAPVP